MKPPRCIMLTRGFVAIISAEDYRRVNRYKWHVHFSKGTKKKPGQPYARANINGKKIYLHRYVTNCPDHLEPDHKNHCTLDCRQENLELTDRLTNNRRRRGNYGIKTS